MVPQEFTYLSQPFPKVGSHPEDGRSDIHPDPGVLRRLQHLRFPEIVIGGRGHAVVDHLRDPQQSARIDILFGHFALVRPDHLIEPDLRRDILGDPFENIHGGMGMQVHQTGADELG